MSEASIKDGEKDIALWIRDKCFSLQKDYSQLSCIELIERGNIHEALCEEIAKNSIWTPDKDKLISAHMTNLRLYLGAVERINPACGKRNALELAVKQINERYKPIVSDIVDEERAWQGW